MEEIRTVKKVSRAETKEVESVVESIGVMISKGNEKGRKDKSGKEKRKEPQKWKRQNDGKQKSNLNMRKVELELRN